MACRWYFLVLIAACAAGCSGDPESPRYLPDWPESRSALVAALTDWRESPPPYPPSRELRGIVFADKQRKPDDRLRSFAVLGETEVENARQFTVRLEIQGDDTPRLVRYNVLGRDPIWVFRLEDYEMISHWEHPMNDDPEDNTPARSPGQDGTEGAKATGASREKSEAAPPSATTPRA